MSKNRKKGFDFGMAIGILGTLAGIYLVTQGDYVIGFAGGIASACLAYMNYVRSKGK